MASRIDNGAEMMARTVIQTGKSIGLIYDLAADRIRFVEIGSRGFDAATILRIVTPRVASRRESSIRAMTATLLSAG